MALYKLHDFDPSYRDNFNGDDIKGLDVYAGSDEKIGKVHDALVDEEGTFRYLIVDMGFWVFGKKVMLPVGQSRIDYDSKRVYANLRKEQVESLPEFTDELKVDYDYEERVRGVYRPSVASSSSVADAVPLDTSYQTPIAGSTPVDATSGVSTGDVVDRSTTSPVYNQDAYTYQQDAPLYTLNDQDHQTLKLYQERLLANKQRTKTGEVSVGKRIETETQRVSVPLEKERVVIEHTSVGGVGAVVSPGTVDFQEGEVARVEVYEETADIQKETFVREEVQVRKEIDREVVDAEETLRREELDVNMDGNPVINRRSE